MVQGNWQLAEQLFQQLEAEAKTAEPAHPSSHMSSPSSFNALYAVDWASSQPAQAGASSGWEHQQAVMSMSHMAASPVMPINTSVSMTEVDDRRLSSGSFGDMPTHLAEQVGSFACWCHHLVHCIAWLGDLYMSPAGMLHLHLLSGKCPAKTFI